MILKNNIAVIGIFKQKNPGNALILLVYALVLKFSMFLHPALPVLHPEDNYLYRLIFRGLDSVFHQAAIGYAILSFVINFYTGDVIQPDLQPRQAVTEA